MREQPAITQLKAMHYFVHVARVGSFSAAARLLRLTQPAVSRQVRSLERAIGVPLLYRNGRNVVPTEAGEILLARAVQLEESVANAYEDVRAGAVVPSGTLALGVSSVIGQLVLPLLIRRFASKYPKVKLHLFEGYSSFVEEWLTQERVDAGLIWGKPRSSEVVVDPVLALEMSLIAPAKPLPGCENGKRPVTQVRYADLARFPMILPALPHPLRLLAERAAEQSKSHLDIAIECDGVVLARELVKEGLGYTLLAHSGEPDDVRAGKLRVIRIGPPRLYWILSLVRRRNTPPTVALGKFAEEVRAIAREKLASGELRGRILGPGDEGKLRNKAG